MIEQFAVRRRLPEHAEVVHRRHNPAPKQMLPHAVHDHARGERIGRREDFLRQREPPAARAVVPRVRPAESLDKSPRHRLARRA